MQDAGQYERQNYYQAQNVGGDFGLQWVLQTGGTQPSSTTEILQTMQLN